MTGNMEMKNNVKGCIAVVGMGPGRESMMTQQALQALDAADVIVGYTVYLELLGDRFAGKEMLSTPMKQEVILHGQTLRSMLLWKIISPLTVQKSRKVKVEILLHSLQTKYCMIQKMFPRQAMIKLLRRATL